jgi:hypothetical protein
MNTKRIEEIQKETAYPDSISVQQALLKVWNECEQEMAVKNNAVLPLVRVMLPDNAVPHDIAKEFTNTKLKVVNTLLSDDYKTGYREGITHFIEAKGN